MYHITFLLEDGIRKSRNYRQIIPYAQVKRTFNWKLKRKWMASSGVTKTRFCALKIFNFTYSCLYATPSGKLAKQLRRNF